MKYRFELRGDIDVKDNTHLCMDIATLIGWSLEMGLTMNIPQATELRVDKCMVEEL